MSKNRVKALLDELSDYRKTGFELYPSVAASHHVQQSAKRLIKFAGMKPDREHLVYLLSVISDHLFEDWPHGNHIDKGPHIDLLLKVEALQATGNFRDLEAMLKHLLAKDEQVRVTVQSRKRPDLKKGSTSTPEERDFIALKSRFRRALEYAKAGRLNGPALSPARAKAIVDTLKELTPRATSTMNVRHKPARKKSGYHQSTS